MQTSDVATSASVTRPEPQRKMELSKLQRDTLQKSRLSLIKDLDVGPLVDHLVSEDILTEADEGLIIGHKSQRAKVLALLKILPKKGADNYETFRGVLRGKQPFLWNKLKQNEVLMRQMGSSSPDIPMTDEHRKTLKQSRVFLIRNLDVDSSVDYLVSEFILTAQDEEDVEVKKQQNEKVATLTQILARRGDSAYKAFLTGLIDNQEFIYNELQKIRGSNAAGDHMSNVHVHSPKDHPSVPHSTINSGPQLFPTPFNGGTGPSSSTLSSNPSNNPSSRPSTNPSSNLVTHSSSPSLPSSATVPPTLSVSSNQVTVLQDIRGKHSRAPPNAAHASSDVPESEDCAQGNRSDTKQDDNRRGHTESDSQSYDILLVHSIQDIDKDIYQDVTILFKELRLSLVSIHELQAGPDVFTNFDRMLEKCQYTVCLLTPGFLTDKWCDRHLVQACERSVRKSAESVVPVKAKGFRDEDIPAALKGISGADHSNPFCKSVLRKTFADYLRKRKANSGTATSSVIHDLHPEHKHDDSVKPPPLTASAPLLLPSQSNERTEQSSSNPENLDPHNNYPTMPTAAIVKPTDDSLTQNSMLQDRGEEEPSATNQSPDVNEDVIEGQSLWDPEDILKAINNSQRDWISQQISKQKVVNSLKENCRHFNLEFHGSTPADGNCFYHAVSDQLDLLSLPSQSAEDLRQVIVSFMRRNPTLQGPDGTINIKDCYPNWDAYCDKMSKDGEWADQWVLVATAHMLRRNIMVVMSTPETTGDQARLEIRGGDICTDQPLRLGHLCEWHYQSLQTITVAVEESTLPELEVEDNNESSSSQQNAANAPDAASGDDAEEEDDALASGVIYSIHPERKHDDSVKSPPLTATECKDQLKVSDGEVEDKRESEISQQTQNPNNSLLRSKEESEEPKAAATATAAAALPGVCGNLDSEKEPESPDEDVTDAHQEPNAQLKKKSKLRLPKPLKTVAKKIASPFKKSNEEPVLEKFCYLQEEQKIIKKNQIDVPEGELHQENRSQADQKATWKRNQKKTTTKLSQWIWDNKTAIKGKTTFKAGIPVIAEGEIIVGLENTVSIGYRKEKRKAEADMWELTVEGTVKPMTELIATIRAEQWEFKVPFEATFSKGDKTWTERGTYTGVQCVKAYVKYASTPIKGVSVSENSTSKSD